MKIRLLPAARSWRRMTNSLSVSPRSRPDVGSSRIRNGGSVVSARAISTICRSSKARLRTDASRRIRSPRRSRISSRPNFPCDGGRRRGGSPAPGQARYFARHRGPGPVGCPDRPWRSRGPARRAGSRTGRASRRAGSLPPWAENAGENAHERGLAGAVLADKPMDLAAVDVERRPLQRLNARKAFLDSDDAKRRSGLTHVGTTVSGRSWRARRPSDRCRRTRRREDSA